MDDPTCYGTHWGLSLFTDLWLCGAKRIWQLGQNELKLGVFRRLSLLKNPVKKYLCDRRNDSSKTAG